MKCQQCVKQYLDKTLKLLDIKKAFIITQGNSYCAKHWFPEYFRKNNYAEILSSGFQSNLQAQQQDLEGMRSYPTYYNSGIFGGLGNFWWR